MDIAAINSNTSQVQAANGQMGNAELGKEDFLQLLVTQLRHQDPVNPMKSAEFASQLAQFNSVEQLINVNDGLKQLSQQQQSMSSGLVNTMAASLTGKQVKVQTDQISLGESGSRDINFNLGSTASDATITIRDADGTVVRTEELQNLTKGENSWTWNGRNNSGTNVPEGEYTVEVAAKDGDTKVKSTTYLNGTVDKIKYSSEGVKLIVDGISVGLGDVEEIGESPQDE